MTPQEPRFVPFIDRCLPCQQYGAPAARPCQTCGAYYFTNPVPLSINPDLDLLGKLQYDYAARQKENAKGTTKE